MHQKWPGQILLGGLLTLGLAVAVQAAKDDWRPVDAQHLSMQSPRVDENADAEAIFWEVSVEDQSSGGDVRTVLQHYIRIKIFNERGRKSQSTIDIPFTKSIRIDRIAARTIQPNGRIVELDKDSIYERTLVKISGIKIKVRSFAMPGVEPGSIIEYRWRETRKGQLANYARFEFQRDIPVQLVTYLIKPLKALERYGYGMRGMTLNGSRTPFERDKKGFFRTSMKDVPAFQEERNMPPEPSIRPWMLLFYSDQWEKTTPQQFWTAYSKDLFKRMKPLMKVNGDVKKLAARLTGQTSNTDEKLQRIFEYCRDEVRSIYDDAVELSDKDRKKGRKNNSPSDTIKRGFGTDLDIDLLFAALANASGFEARYALMGDRSDFFFSPHMTDDYFLTNWAIAVRKDGQWEFHSPASRHLPFGMLRWQGEAQQALILDSDQPLFVETPLAEAQQSLQKRTAQLQLGSDGSLQGRCRIEYTGHQAASRRESLDDETPEERRRAVREMVQEWFNNAQISQVEIENLEDPSKPLAYSWQVVVPSYAQGTAKRLFLQPAFFQTGREPRFSSSQRHHRIYFNYRWSEEDHVAIDLPDGMVLESSDSPAPFSPQKVAQYSAQLEVAQKGRQLIYQRRFAFRGLLFPVSSYSGLKQIFDDVHQRDTHTLILRQQAEGGR